MTRRTLLWLMLVLAVIGLGFATYQTYEHYYLTSGICDISESFSCSVVTESRFGEFPHGSGIAVAAYGVLWWLGLIGLLGYQLRNIDTGNASFYTWAWHLIGLVTVAYLLLVELYWLPMETGQVVICPFCTVQHVIILLGFGLSFLLLEKPVQTYIEDIFYTEVE